MKSLTNPGAAEQRRFDLLASIALAVIAIMLYLPTLGADFVYDSRMTVLGNDYAHHFGNLWDVITLRVMHLDVMDNNRPVYLAMNMLGWAVWGASPVAYHLCDVILHATAAVLLYRFCRALLPKTSPWASFAAVLLFVVHPLNCESVSEVSYRNDLMVAVYLLGALNLATVFQPEFSRRNILLGAAIVACMYLGIGSKENAAAGPLLLAGYWLLYRRNEPRAPWIALCATALLVVVAFLIARFTLRPAVSVIFVKGPERPGDGTLETLATIQPRIWAFYLRQIAWPMDLSPDYGWYSVRNFYFITSLVVVVGVAAVQMFAALQNRAFAIGMALFWFALLTVSNIAPMYRPIADRFLYVPMAGVAIMLASLPWSWARGNIGKAAMALVAVTTCVLACSTFDREKIWHDDVALWSDGVKKNPFSLDAHDNLAGALSQAGRNQESVAEYENVIAMSKGSIADSFAGMALPLDALGRTREADEAFKKAAALDKRYAHPDLLTKALLWEKTDVVKLQVIADRNPDVVAGK